MNKSETGQTLSTSSLGGTVLKRTAETIAYEMPKAPKSTIKRDWWNKGDKHKLEGRV